MIGANQAQVMIQRKAARRKVQRKVAAWVVAVSAVIIPVAVVILL